MPFYRDLDAGNAEGKRVINRILDLRKALRAEIPEKTHSRTLLLATWNIRDFDKPKGGKRLQEAIHYIAEIVSAFDLVAVQEVYRDLRGLKRLMDVLGPDWDYVATDATEGSRGNDERMVFLYDNRKVRFGGVAGEMVLPPKRKGGKVQPALQVWRTPFLCAFQAGWSRFMLASVHILWGSGGAASPDRIQEISDVAAFLKKRTEDETSWSRSIILLGDFNIFSRTDDAYKALKKGGFAVPEQIKTFATNAAQDRQYDQIAVREQGNRIRFTKNAGVFNYYDHVFKTQDEKLYKKVMGAHYAARDTAKKKASYYRTNWRTHQMSDHLPLWVEMEIDFSDAYLRRKLRGDA